MSERLAALLVFVVGCQASEPSDTKSRQQPSQPSQPNQPGQPGIAPADATSLSADDEAIPVTLPSTRPRPDGTSDGASSVGDPSASESFGPGRSLPECLSGCDARRLSEDNHATCRLLCESHHVRADTAEHDGILDAYVGCFDQCDGESSCRKRCAADVGRDDACARRCLDELGQCLAPCEGAAQESRCTERCEAVARSCVGACSSN